MIELVSDNLTKELRRSLSGEQILWLETALEKIGSSADPINECLNQSALAQRKLGLEALKPDAEPILLKNGIPMPVRHWSHSDAGRALLILRAASANAAQTPLLIKHYFEQGDESEVGAITRLLIVFDNGEDYKFHAREVGRTNSKPLFAKLAQYNPYPAVYYSDHEFNQLVLKALFLGISVEPVIGLQRRANPELSQMCEDYINERIAADRSIPIDIWLALEPFASPAGEQMMIDHLDSDISEQRYFAIKAMLQTEPISQRRREILDRHSQIEANPEIRALIFSNSTVNPR